MSRRDQSVYRHAEERLFAEYGAGGVVEHFVEVPRLGSSIRVLEIGEGEPIVFLHGSPNCAATWIPLTAELSGRKCLLVERPGAGLSPPAGRWDDHRADSVGVVGAVVDHFDLPATDLVGSSFGGLYAYNYALAHPDRVRSLVQMGSPGGPAVLGMPAIFRFLSLPLPKTITRKAMSPDAAKAREMFEEIGHGAAIEAGAIPDEVFTWYSALLCHTDTVVHLVDEIRAIASPLGYRKAARLDDAAIQRLSVPLLYLWGDEDPFATPERADALSALNEEAAIEHFDGFGHVLWYDDPTLVAERLQTFLRAQDKSTTR